MCVVVDFATKCNYICDCCFCIVHRTRKKKKELNVPDFLNTLQGFQQFDLIEPMHRTMLLVLLLVPSKNLLLLIQDRKIRSSESQSRRSKENFDENYCRKLGYSEETSK
jgi:hypothetical protein